MCASDLREERSPIFAAGGDDLICQFYLKADIWGVLRELMGLQYVDNRPAASIGPTSLWLNVSTLWAIAALPAELVSNFRQAIIDLDVKMIPTYIARIQNHDRPLADNFVNFQFEQLSALTNPQIEAT